MKNEDLFKYQEEAMTLLTKAYKKQKFAHAYLLDGENGTGITDAAIYMAKQLICKKDNAPCMECDDCKQIDAKTHLNYIYIEPENDTIPDPAPEYAATAPRGQRSVTAHHRRSSRTSWY